MALRTYDSYKLSRSFLFFICAMLLVLTGIGIFVFTGGIGRIPGPPPPKGIAILWLGVLAWIWYYYLRIPLEIRFQDEDTLEFRSLVGRTVVATRDIVSIKGMLLSPGFIKIRHRGGTIRLLSQITGLYELIGVLKTINPAIEITGC